MPAATRDVVPLAEATRAWFAISLQTFGGPAGQIAVMQHKLVEQKRWLSQQRFLHALNYCMLLPGPEAQQLAIYTGWLLNGTRGGLIAGSLFVLPGFLALLALSAIYIGFGDTTLVIIDLRRSGPGGDRDRGPGGAPGGQTLADPSVPGRARHGRLRRAGFFAVPFPVVVLGAGAAGLARRDGSRSAPLPGTRAAAGPPPLISDDALHHDLRPPAGSYSCSGSVWLLWTLPLAAVARSWRTRRRSSSTRGCSSPARPW